MQRGKGEVCRFSLAARPTLARARTRLGLRSLTSARQQRLPTRAGRVMSATSSDDGYLTIIQDADPLVSISSSGAFLWPAVLRVCAALLCFILILFVCIYVLCCHRRLRALCGIRALLCFCLLLWVACTLAARRSTWDLVLVPIGVEPFAPDGFELFCAVHSALDYGVAEPLAFSLIGLVFHNKARPSAATGWRPWRLVRFALAFTLLMALLHLGLLLLDRFAKLDGSLLGPQPRLQAPSSPPTMMPSPHGQLSLAADLPSPPNGVEAAVVDSPRGAARHRWWLAEGCAATYGAVLLTALFMVCFVATWTYACLRLARTLLNHKMRARLRFVQFAFTLAPPLLVLLRIVLLFFPASWSTTRRLLRDAELLGVVTASLYTAWALVCRPVLEAAPVAAQQEQQQPHHQPALGVEGIEVGTLPITCRSEDRTRMRLPRWLERRFRSGLTRGDSELGAAISVHSGDAAGTPCSPEALLASPPRPSPGLLSPLGLFMLGRYAKDSTRRPTLSVAVNLCDDSPARSLPARVEGTELTPAADGDSAIDGADLNAPPPPTNVTSTEAAPPTPTRQVLEPLPAPIRLASRLERARLSASGGRTSCRASSASELESSDISGLSPSISTSRSDVPGLSERMTDRTNRTTD